MIYLLYILCYSYENVTLLSSFAILYESAIIIFLLADKVEE
jgi:hypothetical protein